MKLGNQLKTALIFCLSSVLFLFQRLSQIFASLTRETEVSALPWTRTEKTLLWLDVKNGQRAWRNNKPVLTLNAITDEEGHPLENEDDSGRRLCEYWRTIFQARQEGPRHHQHDDILRHVQQAPDDIIRTVDQTEFDGLLALKKDSAPGPDGIPYGVYRCAGGSRTKTIPDGQWLSFCNGL